MPTGQWSEPKISPHQEIDLKHPGPNRGSAGFSDEEREKFQTLLDAGFTDTFRYRNPHSHARLPPALL